MMTPDQADKRITSSERILEGWTKLAADNALLASPHSHALLADEEIEDLISIAARFPAKGDRAEQLINRWITFIEEMERLTN